jgi:hypothetical protein
MKEIRVLLVFLVSLLFCLNLVYGEISVGVREGDWIEYTVSTSGLVPEEFKVAWAKMEIIKITPQEIHADVATISNEGVKSSLIMIFNLEQGKVGAWFIIPAGLNPGEFFYDKSMGCNIIIEGEEELFCAGATRTINNASTSERLKRWDKATGIFVECIDVFETYSINATAIKTNMWRPSTPTFMSPIQDTIANIISIPFKTFLLIVKIFVGFIVFLLVMLYKKHH